MVNIEFNLDYPIPIDHQGTEPVIIIGEVGRTLIQMTYVDNGCSVNIIYENCLKHLSKDVKNYVQPTMSAMVGFSGKHVWLIGRKSFPFTLGDYIGSM